MTDASNATTLREHMFVTCIQFHECREPIMLCGFCKYVLLNLQNRKYSHKIMLNHLYYSMYAELLFNHFYLTYVKFRKFITNGDCKSEK